MFQDARNLPRNTRLEADVCVIGAGAAGITLALEFAGQSTRVLVLESGGATYERTTQKLHEGLSVGLHYEPLNLCRVRGFGGSTGSRGWGGWCKPLSPIDFEHRPWVPMSGWPFSRADIDPFYKRAYRSLGLSPETSQLNSSNTLVNSLLELDRKACDSEFSVLSPIPEMGRSGEARLQAAVNVTVLLHANVTEIETDRDARTVIGVRAATLGGNAFSAKATIFVLAAGGIENARLLLVSNRVKPNGLGNDSNHLGRCFMEHPRFTWGALKGSNLAPRLSRYSPAVAARERELNSGNGSAPPFIGAGLVLDAAMQRKEAILNARSWIVPAADEGETESGRELLELLFWLKKRRIPSDTLSRLCIAARDPLSAGRTIAAYFRGRSGRAQRWQFITVMEQQPNPSSRITLDATRDALGVPRARLDWRLGGLEYRTLRRNQDIITGNLVRLGLECCAGAARGAGKADDEPAPRWVWHHMGTTRMAADPKHGVVDSDCRVHSMRNLYIGGSSVFPTGGNDMPTLTIVALAHRLADHLKAQFQRPAAVAEAARERSLA
jgi:choline dehydrogenase-like flavoprotein